MREDQAAQIIDLLGDLVEQVRGMRSDFMEFTGYNTTKMETLSSEITGPTGYHLGDLHEKLAEIDSKLALIDINTQP